MAITILQELRNMAGTRNHMKPEVLYIPLTVDPKYFDQTNNKKMQMFDKPISYKIIRLSIILFWLPSKY